MRLATRLLGLGLAAICSASACATSSTGSGGTPPDRFVDAAVSTGSVSGFVLTPALSNPDAVYNAIVYVPKGPVAPFPEGVACERCGNLREATAVVSTITKPDGSFTLQGVPAGNDVPLVIQVGRWRRQVTIPVVAGGSDTKLPRELTRLPRSRSEGDLPRIAVATALIDPFECVLKKMGVDPFEFDNGEGRVHFYQTKGEMGSNGATLGPGTPPASELWSNLNELKKYDIVLLPCEHTEILKTAAETQNIIDYASAGGRVFTTHYGYVWVEKAQSPFPETASWHPDNPMNDGFPPDVVGEVDTSFPKGSALKSWLAASRVSANGVFQIHDARYNVDAVNPSFAQRWAYTSDPKATVQAFSFNAPVGAAPDAQCGRVVYTNFHVAQQQTTASGDQLFPSECDAQPLTAQERVLEFMLLDLASCVLADHSQPEPPK